MIMQNIVKQQLETQHSQAVRLSSRMHLESTPLTTKFKDRVKVMVREPHAIPFQDFFHGRDATRFDDHTTFTTSELTSYDAEEVPKTQTAQW